MDINLIKTYLAIVETGSFIDAAEKIHITQSTVSARIKNLEQQLGQPLFTRSKAGASLTQTGEQFHKHAIALLRVWEHARLDVGLAEEHQNHISIGGQVSLWEGFLLKWLVEIKRIFKETAITATLGHSSVLSERLLEGTVDLAVLYRPTQRPGLVLEHIFDDELVLVTSNSEDNTRPGSNYVLVNWGPEFLADHAVAYPEMKNPALNLDLGALAINYLLEEKAAGYFPARTAAPYIEQGALKLIPRAPRFVYPVYAVYSETIEESILPKALKLLRRLSSEI